MRTEEQKKKWAEYMREYLKRNPDKYNKMKLNMKDYVKNNREKIRTIKHKYYYNNLLQIKARKKVCRVPIKPACEICGDIEHLEKHHWNYNKPKLVNTLCRYCHKVQHHRRIL